MEHPGFHLGFSSRGEGGANVIIAELRGGGKDYNNISSVFPSIKNDIVLINMHDYIRWVWR